jgi:hypothetical protein
MPITALTTRATTDPTAVYRYRDGLYAADLLTAAIVHFDFFSWLAAHPSTLDTICVEFDFASRPADVLLTLAATNGLVRCTEGVYAVTDTAREHLVSGSPFHLAPYFASLEARPVVSDFRRVLRSGQPAHWGAVEDGLDWHKAMEDEAFAQSFTDAMDCRGLYLAQALVSKIDLAGAARRRRRVGHLRLCPGGALPRHARHCLRSGTCRPYCGPPGRGTRVRSASHGAGGQLLHRSLARRV